MSHSSALLPVRGIIPVANRKGRPIADRDLHRWLRIERARTHVLKCDLLVHGPAPKRLPDLVAMGMGPVDPHQDLPRPAAMIPLIQDLGATMDVYPLWWSLALGACLGGNGTAIGASANVVVIGIAEREGIGISFVDFLKVGMLVLFVTVAVGLGILWLKFAM
ncbi:MAG: hypothetical protein PWR16_1653 [Methanoculleus sp.]|nr:hypothetical protein [Methanoculleus sp.]